MELLLIYLIGIFISSGISLLIISLIRLRFKRLLIDICSTENRANFWLLFSNILLFLIPLVLSLNIFPNSDEEVDIFFQLSKQIKWGLIGLIISMSAIGIIIVGFMRSKK